MGTCKIIHPTRFAAGTLFLLGALQAGTVTGTITFTKSAPQVALVYMEDEKPSTPTEVHLDQVEKQFTRELVAGTSGATVVFTNSDKVEHNIYANDAGTGISFDAGLIPPGGSAKQLLTWNEGEVVRVGCKIHPRMQSYIANVPGTHYSVVEFETGRKDAEFILRDLPDNLKEIRFWFPKGNPFTITIEKGGKKTSEILNKGKPVGSVTIKRT